MPKIIWRGKHKNKEGNNLHNIIVSQLAGPSLKDYFNKMYCMFTKETIFIIGLELVKK